MTGLSGSLGSINPSALSADFASGWSRFSCEQLVDTLVGDAQYGGGISHADPSTGELGGSLSGSLKGETVCASGLFTSVAGLLNSPLCGLGQNGMGDERDLVFVNLEPQGRGFAHTGEGLLDGFSPGVDSWFFFELDGPAAILFPLQTGGVGLHVRLLEIAGIVHRLSHLGPRQGSRSRSMDLNVPAGMSPLWTGTTVWQVSQRQTWCDPRWRNGSHPSWRSVRINARAVTGSVYHNRRIIVYAARRTSVLAPLRAALPAGSCPV